MKFSDLVTRISGIDGAAQVAAGRSLQQVLSLRNWLIGAYIIEFEQGGEDRAEYGQRLIPRLAEALTEAGRQGFSSRNLHNFRKVALAYPGLDAASLGRRLAFLGPGILQTSAESELPLVSNGYNITPQREADVEADVCQTSGVFGPDGEIRQTSGISGQDGEILQTSAKSSVALFPSLAARAQQHDRLPWRDEAWLARLFSALSFSHLLELSRVDDPVRRAFYELHCLKESWSVKELQRQRDSMLYERIGLSEQREAVLDLARQGTLAEAPAAQLRDPYIFEFLGLERRAVVTEGALEQALVDNLQQFLLELGRDFCFVARQYRITTANRHHYLDLLFFHRGLRCLVAIDLKLGAFTPEHAGQLRFYVNYLAENMTHPDENPPVGILLCADRDAEVVRLTTAGATDLFVARYQLELPSEEQLKQWLDEQRAWMEKDQ